VKTNAALRDLSAAHNNLHELEKFTNRMLTSK